MPAVAIGRTMRFRISGAVPVGAIVERRDAGMRGGWTRWRQVARARSGASVFLRIRSGWTTCVRVRAGRRVTQHRCTTGLLDGAALRSRAMRTTRHAYAAGGTLLVARRPGASVATRTRVRADLVGVRVYACADCGRIAIKVNGRVRARVSTRRRDAGFRTFYVRRLARTSTVRLEVVALDRKVVRVDGLVVRRLRG